VALGIDPSVIARGLESFTPESGRLQIHDLGNGVTLIDDAYNANPASARAAVDVAKLHSGKRVVVLGDMAELGADAGRHHYDLGVYAKDNEIDQLIGFGELSRGTVDGFGSEAAWYDNMDELVARVMSEVERGGVTVLVKGSRSMRMERVVDALLPAKSGVAH